MLVATGATIPPDMFLEKSRKMDIVTTIIKTAATEISILLFIINF